MKLIESSKVLTIQFEYTELQDFNSNLELALTLLMKLHKDSEKTSNAGIYYEKLKPFQLNFEQILLDNEYD